MACPIRSPLADPTSVLDLLWGIDGTLAPRCWDIDAHEVPEPQRQLLVHSKSMTAVIEAFYRTSVQLRVLAAGLDGDVYGRRVMLVQQHTGKPLLAGAIRIRMGELPLSVQGQILEGTVPLGRVCQAAAISFTSRPLRYFCADPSADLSALFQMVKPEVLYGRHTAAACGSSLIGDIVEIVPPACV